MVLGPGKTKALVDKRENSRWLGVRLWMMMIQIDLASLGEEEPDMFRNAFLTFTVSHLSASMEEILTTAVVWSVTMGGRKICVSSSVWRGVSSLDMSASSHFRAAWLCGMALALRALMCW